ncbi:MAG: DUF4011 domain-containing protein, partial [Phycisphaerae bacterium]
MSDARPGQAILTRMLDRLFASVLSGPAMNCRPHNSRQRIDMCQLAALRDTSPTETLRAILGDAATAKLSARVEQPPSDESDEPSQRTVKRAETDRSAEQDVDSPAESPATSPAAPAESPRESAPVEKSLASPPADDTSASAANPTGESEIERESDARPPSNASRSDQQRAFAAQKTVLSKLRIVADDAKTYFDDTGVHVLSVGFPILSIPPGAWSGKSGATSRRILAPLAFIPVDVTVKGG